MERLQELCDGDVADAVGGAAGSVPEGAGEEGLARADGTAEDDVLLLGRPVQAEEFADAGAIEADRARTAVPEGDEESADQALASRLGSGHSPNRPKSTSPPRRVVARQPAAPNWCCAKRCSELPGIPHALSGQPPMDLRHELRNTSGKSNSPSSLNHRMRRATRVLLSLRRATDPITRG